LSDQGGRRRVLFVCTANICRSPTAELIARRRFGEDRLLFRSAGFLESGESCPAELVNVLRAREIDAAAHRSYTLDEESVQAADLLFTMEGSHVQKATMLSPEAFAKIVPLKEAASVISELTGRAGTVVTVEQFVEELNRDRDPRQYLGTRWDVADPYGGRAKQYRAAVEEIDQLVQTVVGAIR
jgi:protein-tyrosine-phosphatase